MWRSAAMVLIAAALLSGTAAVRPETRDTHESDDSSSAAEVGWFGRNLLQTCSRLPAGPTGTCCIKGITPPCACPDGGGLNTPNGRNCGTCNVNCHTTQTCASVKVGANTASVRRCDCTAVAGRRLADCDRLTSNGCESDLLTDKLNCGSCGSTCDVKTQDCLKGVCTCKAGGGTDFVSDTNNCGACGKVCANGQACTAGVCKCADRVALNSQNDAKVVTNCATCGNTCRANQDCVFVAGVRQCACREGFADRDGNMANGCEAVTTSRFSCGPGGVKCLGDMQCINKQCACPNTIPAVTSWNDINCGKCGQRCTGGQKCDAAGVCRCSAGEENGVTDLTTKANCGACGNSCERGTECLRNGTTFSCSCPALSRTSSPYTVTNWRLDANCGECGNNCTAFANMRCVTTAGVSDCACTAGFASCDEKDGCEVNINNNADNCGKCGDSCDTAKTKMICAAKQCVCQGAFDDEGNLVTDVTTSDSHCGSCGNACNTDAGQTCDNGVCRCEDGSALLTTPSNCGACGNQCPEGQNCVDGECGCKDTTTGELVSIGTVERCTSCDDPCGSNQECMPSGDTGYYCECMAGWADCDMDGSCETPLDSTKSCGECGATCGTGQSCEMFEEAYTCTCPTVDGMAAALGTPENCAACGQTCNNGTACIAAELDEMMMPTGPSACMCEAIPDAAAPFNANYLPANYTTSPNCGTCGNVCGANQECVAGEETDAATNTTTIAYSCACLAGFVDCDLDAANGCELAVAALDGGSAVVGDTLIVKGCGACGVTCNGTDFMSDLPTNTQCLAVANPAAGEPAFQCACPLSKSDSLSTITDCGVCGNKCLGGSFCDDGTCRCVNPTTGTRYTVADFSSSATDCGRCGNACANGQTCTAGVCQCGTTGPTKLTTDAACGNCDTACTAAQVCYDGACVPRLAAPAS